MSKPTVATLKSFIRKNEADILIAVKSSFDGMTDCVEQCSGKFKPLTKCDRDCGNNLGYNSVWLVGQSRDYVRPYEKDGYKGFEVDNCCGNWIVVVPVSKGETDHEVH